MVDAIVLAGSPNDGLLKGCSSVAYEALIPIGSRVMVEYVVEALLKASKVNKIVVVGPEELLHINLASGKVTVTLPSKTVLDNVQLGIKSLPAKGQVLVVTSDIPLITGEAIDDFLEHCSNQAVDLYYPVVARKVMESCFANLKRTYVTLREGTFTGGNIFLLNPDIFPRCLLKGQRLVEARKNPLQMARLLGFTFLLKFLTHRLSLAEAQDKVSELLGIKGAVVISSYPEVGFDVDKPDDLKLATRILQYKK